MFKWRGCLSPDNDFEFLEGTEPVQYRHKKTHIGFVNQESGESIFPGEFYNKRIVKMDTIRQRLIIDFLGRILNEVKFNGKRRSESSRDCSEKKGKE